MSSESDDTKTGALLGTPFYASPEQARGHKDIDHRADLWALSVVVYQCVTGKLPFRSDALGDLLVKIISDPLPVPSQVARVPPGFDAWWARAANRELAQRFQTAKELAETLGMALDVTIPGTAEVGTKVRSLPATPPPAASAAISEALLLTTGTPATPSPAPPDSVKAPDLPPVPLTSRAPILAVAAVALLLAGGAFVALRGADKGSEGTAQSAEPLPASAISTVSVAPALSPADSAPSAPITAAPSASATPTSSATAPGKVAPQAARRATSAPASKPPAAPKPKTDFGI
jgi:serine/threonine-protein kinase